MKQLHDILASAAKSLASTEHPRIAIAWQDLDLVYTRVHTPLATVSKNLVGKRMEDVLDDPEQAARWTKIKRRILETGEPYSETNIPTVIGGHTSICDLTIEPTFDDAGNVNGLISVTVDITDLMEAKSRLAEANDRLVNLLSEALEPMQAQSGSDHDRHDI